MKHDVMPSIVQMDPEVLKTLLKEVKETVATEVRVPEKNKSTFRVVDMWNILKNSRSASSRVRRW